MNKKSVVVRGGLLHETLGAKVGLAALVGDAAVRTSDIRRVLVFPATDRHRGGMTALHAVAGSPANVMLRGFKLAAGTGVRAKSAVVPGTQHRVHLALRAEAGLLADMIGATFNESTVLTTGATPADRGLAADMTVARLPLAGSAIVRLAALMILGRVTPASRTPARVDSLKVNTHNATERIDPGPLLNQENLHKFSMGFSSSLPILM